MKISLKQFKEIIKHIPEKPTFFNDGQKTNSFIRVPVGHYIEPKPEYNSTGYPSTLVYNTLDFIWHPIEQDWMLELPDKINDKAQTDT